MKPVVRESFVDRRTSYLRWGAVGAGLVFALASWLTLQLVGVGAGLAAIDVDDAGSLHGAGIGAGVWSVAAPAFAMFGGAFLAVKLSQTWSRHSALAQALVLWAFATLAGTFLVIEVTNAVVGATVPASARELEPGFVAIAPSDTDELVAAINTRLRERGQPEIDRAELQTTLRGTVRRSARGVGFDRDGTIADLMQDTSLDRGDAAVIAAQIERRWKGQASALRDRDRTTAAMADAAGKAMLGAGIALLFGLGGAIGGALLALPGRRPARQMPLPADPIR